MSGERMSERGIPPPELRSSSPLSQGDKGNGKRKCENGNLRVSESRSKVYFDYAEREQIQDDVVGLNLRVSESRSMVGTRHAVSDNKSISGLGMPSPYIPERKQIR